MMDYLDGIIKPLLDWYERNARSLPWRDDPTPYRVWVSEIMLQQTRVKTVRPYFDRFMRELPNIHALANATESQILKLWEGLGYYNRVRNMQKAACIVELEHGGELPSSPSELEKLPGIGAYTAGAIASIAFGLPHPAVDGNVLRVFARLKADNCDIALPGTKKQVEDEVRQMMPKGQAGDFTQALMELGAMVCLPNGAPLCGVCPLIHICEAKAAGIQLELPVKKPKAKRRKVKRTILLITDGQRLALQKRQDKGLLAGLWELPSMDGFCDNEEVRRWAMDRGLQVESIAPVGATKHIFTHVEWLMQGFYVKVKKGKHAGFIWPSRVEILEKYAVPSAFAAYMPFFMGGKGNG
ncbi:A/G-specific adenine glycosylase [Christensenellaceae bacterium OttesenSCG-928-K19]|nr:A/G-specific adenine glycosylase [Christensenellaceae bacterium OttesenSCG-928-K19]